MFPRFSESSLLASASASSSGMWDRVLEPSQAKPSQQIRKSTNQQINKLKPSQAKPRQTKPTNQRTNKSTNQQSQSTNQQITKLKPSQAKPSQQINKSTKPINKSTNQQIKAKPSQAMPSQAKPSETVLKPRTRLEKLVETCEVGELVETPWWHWSLYQTPPYKDLVRVVGLVGLGR
mgnify:CR=1 FL=1|jgi:septal ring factor EnvC (AmiA/AmiB activator)